MPEMAAPPVRPEPQYATISQQTEAATLGIWVFLATEVVFFSGLLLAYTVLRHAYPAGFVEAGRETKLVIGSVNTAVLLTSSATMAWAVHAAKIGERRLLTILLIATEALGLVFLGLKGLEYSEEYGEHLVPGLNFSFESPHAHAVELFYFLYFAMTGIHALHLTIGIVIVGIIAWRASRGVFGPRYYGPVEVTGLYWHFVDLVWIFLYPLIYLNGRSG
jgi:cytochrome c oxidase subunit 3